MKMAPIVKNHDKPMTAVWISEKMTFVALTKLQNREPTLLQTVINNTGGNLVIALREFHYEVGYRNTSSTGGFEFEPWVNPSKDYDPFDIASHSVKSFALHEGLHSFKQLSRFFYESVPGITLKFRNSNHLAELDAPEHIGRIRPHGQFISDPGS